MSNSATLIHLRRTDKYLGCNRFDAGCIFGRHEGAVNKEKKSQEGTSMFFLVTRKLLTNGACPATVEDKLGGRFEISACRRHPTRRQYHSLRLRPRSRSDTTGESAQKRWAGAIMWSPDRQARPLAAAQDPNFGHNAPLLSGFRLFCCLSPGSHHLPLIRSTPVANLPPASRSGHKKSNWPRGVSLSDTSSWPSLSPPLFVFLSLCGDDEAHLFAIGLASSRYQRSVCASFSGIVITMDHPSITSP